jgi:uncharacterized protein (TIGR02246 family)
MAVYSARQATLSLVLTGLLFANLALGEDGPTDEAAIRRLAAALETTHNKHDANQFAAIFAPDGDFTNVKGMSARGRQAIEEFHRPLFEGDTSRGNPSFKNAVLKIAEVRVRFLRPDVASVDILWTQSGSVAPDGKDRGIRKGLANWIVTKEKGNWQVAVMHNMDLPVDPAADGREKMIGFWKLVSYGVEVQATGKIEQLMGQHPTGYAYFSPEGRAMFIVTGEGRRPAKTIEQRANLLITLVAYTGTYRIEGDRWITKVDVAWNPEWVGTEQARNFKIEGERLHVLTPWRVMSNWPELGMQRSILTFERSKR